MVFTQARLAGVYVIDPQPVGDGRGLFMRTFCQREFAAAGLEAVVAQANVSITYAKGTVRGLHFQYPPAAETKLVRCTRGAMLDVVVDLRPESPTYLEHLAVELTGASGRALYVPERFAHGYQALEDDTETAYLMGAFYTPGAEGGLRHDDPRLAIRWPLPVVHVSKKDLDWPLLARVEPTLRAGMRPNDPSLAHGLG